jgi:hypothetical protein
MCFILLLVFLLAYPIEFLDFSDQSIWGRCVTQTYFIMQNAGDVNSRRSKFVSLKWLVKFNGWSSKDFFAKTVFI